MKDGSAKRDLRNFYITIAVLLPLFVVAYWVPIKAIVRVWATDGDYSYGFLVPLISAYLFWDMRHKLNEITFKNNWGIFPLLLILVLASVYAILGSSGNVSRPLVPILLILFLVFCLGIAFVREFLVPLGFLIFMVPLPAYLDRTIGVFLKHISSQLGGQLLRLMGMSVFVSGNIIDLGVTKLQVVDACSGLRFVFPLVALGVVYAYFFERVRWKQIVCVVSTIPIAILTNIIRISITGILTYKYGLKMAEGFFHAFSGWAIFMVAFFFLFLEGRILRFFPPRSTPKLEKHSRIKDGKSETGRWIGRNKALWISGIILIIVWLLSFNTGALPPVKISGGIKSFPLKFGDWEGTEQALDPEIVAKSGAEESFSAMYSNDRKEVVSLYIGFRSSAFLENENFFHSPTVCLPAAGWKEKQISTHIVKGLPKFGDLKVTEMVIENMGATELVYFWFQTKDHATHRKDINRFHLALHAIRKDNTYDLFIRLITPIGQVRRNNGIDSRQLKRAQERLDRFARDMMGTLLVFLLERQAPGQ